MGQLLAQRACRLVVSRRVADIGQAVLETTTIRGLRVQFEVTKDETSHPNAAKITITNPAPATRALFSEPGLRIQLYAGYETGDGLIFDGDLRHTDPPKFTGTDVDLALEAGDGGRGHKQKIAESFASGVGAGDVASRLVAAMGLTLTVATRAALNAKLSYRRGHVVAGNAAAEMDAVMKAAGYSWSVQDGELVILPEGEALTDIVELSPETGLIGSPEPAVPTKRKGKTIVKARSLLQARFRPRAQVRIRSRNVNGLFRIVRLKHTGDTAGQAWYSDLEVTPA